MSIFAKKETPETSETSEKTEEAQTPKDAVFEGETSKQSDNFSIKKAVKDFFKKYTAPRTNAKPQNIAIVNIGNAKARAFPWTECSDAKEVRAFLAKGHNWIIAKIRKHPTELTEEERDKILQKYAPIIYNLSSAISFSPWIIDFSLASLYSVVILLSHLTDKEKTFD
jgi:hypothetical protein